MTQNLFLSIFFFYYCIGLHSNLKSHRFKKCKPTNWNQKILWVSRENDFEGLFRVPHSIKFCLLSDFYFEYKLWLTIPLNYFSKYWFWSKFLFLNKKYLPLFYSHYFIFDCKTRIKKTLFHLILDEYLVWTINMSTKYFIT